MINIEKLREVLPLIMTCLVNEREFVEVVQVGFTKADYFGEGDAFSLVPIDADFEMKQAAASDDEIMFPEPIKRNFHIGSICELVPHALGCVVFRGHSRRGLIVTDKYEALKALL